MSNESITPDRWRKRVIAVIADYLKTAGKPFDMKYVKATACRAAKEEDFNKITNKDLKKIYFEFGNKKKILTSNF